jgi:hypothetical protein
VSYYSKLKISKSTFRISLDEAKLIQTQGKGHFLLVRSDTEVEMIESKMIGG